MDHTFYLQMPLLPKRSQTAPLLIEVAEIYFQLTTYLSTPKGRKAELV